VNRQGGKTVMIKSS